VVTHYKTVETTTEPAFIITNNLGDNSSPKGPLLLLAHWYEGGDENPPTLTLDTEGVIYIGHNEIQKLIDALKEFL
jgi:hypothetical protein